MQRILKVKSLVRSSSPTIRSYQRAATAPYHETGWLYVGRHTLVVLAIDDLSGGEVGER